MPAVKKPEPVVIKNDRPQQASDELNWSQTAHELELDALAGQVVINCIVQSWQDNHLKLAYLPELELMIKPGIKEQIKQAIESRLGLELKLDFISVAKLDAETPQQAHVRLQQEERQSAIEAIRQDPVVQKLNSLFGARLIENSVKKVKE
jgi:DNA polymerase III subunit gamma/tau